MLEIYQYLNYREYLRDFYLHKKKSVKCFSFQILASKAGFKSKSFLSDVISGKKNLSEDSIFALGKILELNDAEFLYFKNLVLFNQAKNHVKKDHFFQILASSNHAIKVKQVLSSQYEFYAHWYHSTIRELVSICDFGEDYAFLGRCLKPQISPRQAKESVELLLRLGLIVKKNGRFEQTDNSITTGDTVSSLAVEKFHLQNLSLAAESLDVFSADERELNCIVCSMSREKYNQIQNEIHNFRCKLISLINIPDNNISEKKRVYHISLQVFPTTNENTEAGSND